ncbi:hypothetical protein GCM10027051_13610 [Niabella terrae]
MIQRKQTLWLLLSGISSALTFKFPFYTGTVLADTKGVTGPELSAIDNIFLILLTAAVFLLAIGAIFLFRNRKKQIQAALAGLVGTVALIAVYFTYTKNFAPGGHITLTALLSLIAAVGFYFAIKGIRRDQRLVRDLNRLR